MNLPPSDQSKRLFAKTRSEKKAYVQKLFADITPEYDRCNRILSLWRDMAWRRKAVASLPSNSVVLDIAAGTGDMAIALLERKNFTGQVVLSDFTLGMLEEARHKLKERKLERNAFYVVADAENLPFKAGAFDGAMMGFALRNLTDVPACLGETKRVLVNGGRAAFLEISHPENKLFAKFFYFYFYRVLPFLAHPFTRHPYAYKYLPDSLKIFLTQKEVASLCRQVGFREATYQNLMGGSVAVYRMVK